MSTLTVAAAGAASLQSVVDTSQVRPCCLHAFECVNAISFLGPQAMEIARDESSDDATATVTETTPTTTEKQKVSARATKAAGATKSKEKDEADKVICDDAHGVCSCLVQVFLYCRICGTRFLVVLFFVVEMS